MSDGAKGTGTLYLVGTPIGNLRDITLRALDVLSSVDVIACEDTRRSRILLEHHGITARLVSLPAFAEEERADGLVARLLGGEDVAMITDAGMPGISDPGEKLVRKAIEADVDVVPIPGPSAALAALAASGLPSDRFTFAGFLPRKGKARREALEALRYAPGTLILYESPRRLHATLVDLRQAWGERRACVARELTKLHEEWVRGSLGDLAARFADEVRGEITLLVAPGEDAPPREVEDPVALLREALAVGASRKDAIAQVQARTGLPRKEIYDLALGLDTD